MSSINDLATAAIASSSATRGALVVLEGLDRSGKTTQVKLLEQRFVEEGRPVKVMRFPGEFASEIQGSLWGRRFTVGVWTEGEIDRSTPIGQMIDSYLKSDVEMEDHVIHLLFSANRWEAVLVASQIYI